ncbi:hypothetical protein DPMN_002589 [Dreissena polymorpha]|uniref:Uncharacterized protein n=1 Tax=Dreissena polymorpha TaxID=45954 RepID=A0A9D4MLX3_DREPO|nr:hypothetical protein DPMN_002589 [Dreissena polymorpha]
MQVREYETLANRGLMGSDYDRIADRDVHAGEYDDVDNITETSLQSHVPQIQGATSSTDDGYLQPMTAKLSKDKSIPLKTRD